jgi:RimJ/RimL family protein N-acetyltransferase
VEDDREFLLETERLRMRPYTFGDLDDLFEIVGDPQTMTYYPEPYSRDRTLGWIEDNVRRYEVDGFGLWAMELRETGGFVGTAARSFARSTESERSRSVGT